MLIVIDPGHGGRQPGAVGPTGLLESEVCLAVSLRVRELLRPRALAQSFQLRLTRTTNVDVPLGARIAPPNAACFVSIHCNAVANRTANGTETLIQLGDSARSQPLAEILQRHVLEQLQLRDRGIKQQSKRVLRQSPVPAALVELAFISNPIEEALLASTEGQDRSARAIADGLLEFLGSLKAGRRTHIVAPNETLWGISARYGVTVAQLQEWNRIRSGGTIQIGQRLFIEA